VPFSTSTLELLYPNRGKYVSAATVRIQQLAQEGWILRDDTQAAMADARGVAATLP
jgi:hypothetical protein